MTVVSQYDVRPPARNDGVAWTQLLIEESSTGTGAGTLIETKSMATGPGLFPLGLDTDPKAPISRDWTSDQATLPKGTGWYRVRFKDGANNTSEYTDWVLDAIIPWFPGLRDVATHIRNRTVERTTNVFKGTFTANTRPTDEEAWEAVEQANKDVFTVVGDLAKTGITLETQKAASSVIALRAAMLIERSYYAEQVGENKSPYPALERDYDKLIAQLEEAVAEDLTGDVIPGEGTGEGAPVATDSDHVVPSGSRVLTKTGVWVGSANAWFTFPDDDGGMIGYDEKF